MNVYHRTAHGLSILTGGFRDSTGTYLTGHEWTGVFVSDVPLDSNEGAQGHDLLMVEMDEVAVSDFEWREEGRPYREWCVPASILNRFPRRLLGQDEEAATAEQRWSTTQNRRSGP
jgi:hypothetical protein